MRWRNSEVIMPSPDINRRLTAAGLFLFPVVLVKAAGLYLVRTGPATPKFVLQAILSSSQGKTALIDGKPYRAGDEVRGSGWIVQEITAESRSVTLKDAASEHTITISVELPAIPGAKAP